MSQFSDDVTQFSDAALQIMNPAVLNEPLQPVGGANNPFLRHFGAFCR